MALPPQKPMMLLRGAGFGEALSPLPIRDGRLVHANAAGQLRLGQAGSGSNRSKAHFSPSFRFGLQGLETCDIMKSNDNAGAFAFLGGSVLLPTGRNDFPQVLG